LWLVVEALARIVEISASRPLPGLVWAVRADGVGAASQLESGAPITPIDKGWYWLHFGLADNRIHALLDQLPIAPAADLIHDGEEVLQIHVTQDMSFGTVADMQRGLDGVRDESGYLHFVLCDKLLITARRSSLQGPGATLLALQHGSKAASVEALFELILLQIIEGFDQRIELTKEDIDKLEDRIIGGIIGDARPRLGASRRTVVRIHRHLSNMRTVLQRMNRNGLANPAMQALASNVCQQSEQLEHEILSLRERTRLLQEEVAAMLAEETNKHLRVLSILTILFIPPTFIGGLFGMNLKGILFSEMEHGFWVACLLAAAATACVAWLLKRSGIWARRD